MDEVKVGDIREGTGTHKIRVRVDSITEDTADCTLLRSGKYKEITVRQLQKAYRLVERAAANGG